MRNLYKDLNLRNFSDSHAVKKSYASLARRYHPDASGSEDTVADFIRVSAAKEILLNPDMKGRYDDDLRKWLAQSLDQAPRPTTGQSRERKKAEGTSPRAQKSDPSKMWDEVFSKARDSVFVGASDFAEGFTESGSSMLKEIFLGIFGYFLLASLLGILVLALI